MGCACSKNNNLCENQNEFVDKNKESNNLIDKKKSIDINNNDSFINPNNNKDKKIFIQVNDFEDQNKIDVYHKSQSITQNNSDQINLKAPPRLDYKDESALKCSEEENQNKNYNYSEKCDSEAQNSSSFDKFKTIEVDKELEDDFNSLMSALKPLNDGVEVEVRNPVEFLDKSKYYGEWDVLKNIRHGRGVKLWPSGQKYFGYWARDHADGKGRLMHLDGDVYEGDWKDDKPNGFGTYLHKDGTSYEGHWKNDKQNGEGKEKWPDGSTFEGNYEDGKKQGHGTLRWADGSEYCGNFDGNIFNGKGKYTFKDKRIYDGKWVNGKMEGEGIFEWPDGRKYVGYFKEDKRHGYGEFYWVDGKIYKGQWKNGKQEGDGEMFIPGGANFRKGVWENGKRVKWLEE